MRAAWQSLKMILSGVAVGAAGALVALRVLERSTAGVQSMEATPTFLLMISGLDLLPPFCAEVFVPRHAAQAGSIQ